jgi:integrase
MRQAGSIIKKRKRYYIAYKAPTGKQKWEGGFKTKSAARVRLTEAIGQIQTGIYFEPSGMTFGEYGDQWLKGRVNIVTATTAGYESYLKRHIRPELGEMKLKDIRQVHIQQFVSKLIAKTGRPGKPLAASSIHRVIKMLKALFSSAVKNNLIRFNPAADLELPKAIKPQVQPPSKEDMLKIFEQASVDTRALFILDAMTGIRRGELLALQWGDVDWLNHELIVRRVIRKARATDGAHKYEWRIVESTKGGKSRRIGMAPMVIEILRTMRSAFEQEPDGDAFIFNRNGSFIEPDYFSRCIALPLIKKATGGRVRRFHDLRHFFTSLLIEGGESAKYIQDQVGHASISTTFDIYGHLMPQAKRQASKKLERSLFGKNSTFRTFLEHASKNDESTTIN